MESAESKACSSAQRQRKGSELEKFKRRMIRSVARRMKEKKSDEEVWADMKKEIGSNCKKLWERMRILTLKKLKRLLECEDRVCNIGSVARMTLTDWLLFDLVIVHEKIDVINREKLTDKYHSKVLSNLFALVQRFEIEGRTGENLAEAWTAATVYYNSRGHQCSPMMLQRRWFQIKELTRHKFYKFWFNYRGNQRQLVNAKLDSPNELQKAIALKYPEIVTQKFETWEERIEKRLVILPDELGVKMRQRNLMKPSDTVPDVVLVEPQIEVIDLGANSESEENEVENAEMSETELPLLLKVKSEPVDIDETFEEEHEVHIAPEKGSEFEEEIERLQMVEENFDTASQSTVHVSESIIIDPVPAIDIISNADAAETEHNKEGFTSIDTNDVASFSIVDGNITNVKRNKAIVESVVNDPVPSIDNDEIATLSNADAEETEHNKEGLTSIDTNDFASFRIVDRNITNVKTNEAIMIDDDDGELVSKDASTVNDEAAESVMSKDNEAVGVDFHIADANNCDVGEKSDGYNIGKTVYNSNGVIAEISSVASAGVKVENMDDVIESDVTDNNLDTELMAGISEELFPVISTVSSAGIKVEKDVAVNDIVDNDTLMTIETVQESTANLDQAGEVSEALPEISTVSSEVIKVEIEIEPIEDNSRTGELQPEVEQEQSCSVEPEDDIIPIEDDIIEPIDMLVVEKNLPNAKVTDLEVLADVPMDLNFVSDGIDFADDGIAYIEDDEDDIITIREPPVNENDEVKENEEDLSDEEASKDTKAATFDLKLLMCPVVYTTKLDAMTVFDNMSRYEQVYDKESIDKIYTLSKPVSKQSIAILTEQVIQQEEKNYVDDVHNDLVDENNDTANANLSDDDLFSNKTIEASDSESEAIDESQRVKLSSYLLKKPKHRSYNPVLLCKNPDFNTRLKKLSVGFFMSARNRTLLQSCIPMTIDMSKAFEDKLINGTLYLKPTPNDSVINIQDDVEVTSAGLVKPTTVQQSMMNIDDTLENELKKRMAERIRAINLPDILQVRRLNQHLLTAEVTPLRLENKSQDIKNIIKVSPINYVQNIKNDIDNLLLQQKSIDVSNTEIEVIPEDRPHSPLETVGSPVLRVQPTPPPMVSIPEVQSLPQLQPLSKNTAPSTTKGAEPTTAKVRKPTRRTYYPQLAWNKRLQIQSQINQEQYHADALLTLDTLYKMLSALDPCSKFTDMPKKKKKKKYVAQNKNEETTNEHKTNKDITNQDVVIDITDDEKVSDKKPKSRPRVKVNVRSKDKEYCCWCSYKIAYTNGNVKSTTKRRHKCRPLNCVCCCRELIYSGDTNLVDTLAANQNNKGIEPIADEQEEKNISNTIEHVVQLVNQMKEPKQCDASNQIDMDDVSLVEPSSTNAVITKTTDATIDGTVDDSNDKRAELTPLSPPNNPKPTAQIRVYTGGNGPSAHSTYKNKMNIIQTSYEFNNIDSKFNSNNKLMDNLGSNTKIIPSTCIPSKPTHQTTKVKPPVSNLCTCRANISKVKQGKIEINGSNNCVLHKKQIKESKIVLSKKLITDENQPFFVGKGKILLTNMKMPSKKIEQPAPPTPQQGVVDDLQSIRLPAGVQIVLLPDQTLTYFLEPDVTLTPEECLILPQFLVAIQQQMNALGITLPANHSITKIDEVIDLDKDETTDNPEISTVADTGNDLDSNEQIERIPPTDLVEKKSEKTTATTTAKDFEMEKDSTAKEKTVTANKDFEEITDISAEQKNGVENSVLASVQNIASINKKTETPETKESEAVNEVKTDNPDFAKDNMEKETVSSKDEATNKKSLLSDLMEMSGIMEEDLAPPPLVFPLETPIVQEPIILDTSNFVLQRRVPPSEVDNSTTPTITVPSLSPISPKKYTATNKDGKVELTAVTSFAELKYSCDNNGLFFKLDLETGQLNSINVCIQKFPCGSASCSEAQATSEKSVIDLTDDPDISITGGETEDGTTSQAPIVVQRVLKTQISTILQKKKRLMDRLTNNLKPVNIVQSKQHVARILRKNKSLLKDPSFMFYSKRKRDKIEAKIDLVDSDTPMEEEYLVTSSDDSSDDEPLFKKAKRMRSVDTAESSTAADQGEVKQDEGHLNEPPLEQENASEQQSNVPDSSGDHEKLIVSEQNVQENLGEHEVLNEEHSDQELDENMQEEILDDDYMEQEDDDEEMDDTIQRNVSMPVPTNLLLSGGAFNAHNIPLNTSYRPEDDSQDEDCILGV